MLLQILFCAKRRKPIGNRDKIVAHREEHHET